MVNIRPHIIIQARMGSERLPNKVMMHINGKPMIGYQIERLLKTKLPIIVATSNDSNNNRLVDYVKGLGVEVFRGSEDNVLERYYNAAKLYNATDIIRVTGDNPLIDASFILNQLSIFAPASNRYYLYEGVSRKLPLGMSFEMFSLEMLEEAYKNACTKSEKEHVTPYMHQNMPKNIDVFEFDTTINLPNARLTVDTSDDFELINKLIVDYKSHLSNLEEIVNLLKANNELLKINSRVQQKKWNE